MEVSHVVFIVILGLNVIDYITGLIGGAMTEGFNSSKMRRGLFHKFTYWILLGLCWMLEWVAPYADLGTVVVSGITLLVCSWIIITESGSIMENLVKINPQLEESPFMALFRQKEMESRVEKEEYDDVADCRR